MDEEETVYEFVKDVGWQPITYETLDTETYDGYKIRLILRAPKRGERYLSAPPYSNLRTFRSKVRWRNLSSLTIRRMKVTKSKLVYAVVMVLEAPSIPTAPYLSGEAH